MTLSCRRLCFSASFRGKREPCWSAVLFYFCCQTLCCGWIQKRSQQPPRAPYLCQAHFCLCSSQGFLFPSPHPVPLLLTPAQLSALSLFVSLQVRARVTRFQCRSTCPWWCRWRRLWPWWCCLWTAWLAARRGRSTSRWETRGRRALRICTPFKSIDASTRYEGDSTVQC